MEASGEGRLEGDGYEVRVARLALLATGMSLLNLNDDR